MPESLRAPTTPTTFYAAAYLIQRNMEYNEDLVRHLCLTSAPDGISSSRYDALDHLLEGVEIDLLEMAALAFETNETMPSPTGFW